MGEGAANPLRGWRRVRPNLSAGRGRQIERTPSFGDERRNNFLADAFYHRRNETASGASHRRPVLPMTVPSMSFATRTRNQHRDGPSWRYNGFYSVILTYTGRPHRMVLILYEDPRQFEGQLAPRHQTLKRHGEIAR